MARYRDELHGAAPSLVPLMRYARQGCLTLLSAARHLDECHLTTLRAVLLHALHQEDAADLEPASPPCYLGQGLR